MAEPEPSQSTLAEWTLSDVRVVATLKRGGAIVEACPRMTIQEGRTHMSNGDQDDPARKERYAYEFTFEAADPPGESAMSQWGRIVVTGKDQEGSDVSIEGPGWVGYDEYGRPQGSFLKPPKIRIVIGDDPAVALKKAVAEQWKRNPLNSTPERSVQ